MARDGTVVPGYDEAPVVAHMKGREIAIAVDLGLGKGAATAWTCDLTHGYIDINGSLQELVPIHADPSARAASSLRAAHHRAPAAASAAAGRRRGHPPPGQRLGGGAHARRLPFPYPRDLADEWIASTPRSCEAGTGYHLAITGQEDGPEMLIGCVGLRLDLTPRVGNLGYWVGRRFWGHGVASEAVDALARWALANLDLDRLEAHVAADNPASAAVLRRAGFREAGRGEEAFLARGGEHPVLRFEATRDDLFGQWTPAAAAGRRRQAARAGRRLRADRRGRPRAAGPAAGRQEDGRAVGVPRRQAGARRDAGGRPDPRAAGGAGHRRRRKLPGRRSPSPRTPTTGSTC